MRRWHRELISLPEGKSVDIPIGITLKQAVLRCHSFQNVATHELICYKYPNVTCVTESQIKINVRKDMFQANCTHK